MDEVLWLFGYLCFGALFSAALNAYEGRYVAPWKQHDIVFYLTVVLAWPMFCSVILIAMLSVFIVLMAGLGMKFTNAVVWIVKGDS